MVMPVILGSAGRRETRAAAEALLIENAVILVSPIKAAAWVAGALVTVRLVTWLLASTVTTSAAATPVTVMGEMPVRAARARVPLANWAAVRFRVPPSVTVIVPSWVMPLILSKAALMCSAVSEMDRLVTRESACRATMAETGAAVIVRVQMPVSLPSAAAAAV